MDHLELLRESRTINFPDFLQAAVDQALRSDVINLTVDTITHTVVINSRDGCAEIKLEPKTGLDVVGAIAIEATVASDERGMLVVSSMTLQETREFDRYDGTLSFDGSNFRIVGSVSKNGLGPRYFMSSLPPTGFDRVQANKLLAEFQELLASLQPVAGETRTPEELLEKQTVDTTERLAVARLIRLPAFLERVVFEVLDDDDPDTRTISHGGYEITVDTILYASERGVRIYFKPNAEGLAEITISLRENDSGLVLDDLSLIQDHGSHTRHSVVIFSKDELSSWHVTESPHAGSEERSYPEEFNAQAHAAEALKEIEAMQTLFDSWNEIGEEVQTQDVRKKKKRPKRKDRDRVPINGLSGEEEVKIWALQTAVEEALESGNMERHRKLLQRLEHVLKRSHRIYLRRRGRGRWD